MDYISIISAEKHLYSTTWLLEAADTPANKDLLNGTRPPNVENEVYYELCNVEHNEQFYNTSIKYDIDRGTSNITTVQLPNSDVGEHAVSDNQNLQPLDKKREIHLLKNRMAAKRCRENKKSYVQLLEKRILKLENENKNLIEELKTLKELYCQKKMKTQLGLNQNSNNFKLVDFYDSSYFSPS